MSLERTVLLVSPTPTLSDAVAQSLRRTGYRLMVVDSYWSARLQLDSTPHVLVTELKLGEFNGLQLALRGHRAGVRAIVVAEKSFEAEIEQLGATWLSLEDAANGELPAVITRLLSGSEASTASAGWFDRDRPREKPAPLSPAYYASVVH